MKILCSNNDNWIIQTIISLNNSTLLEHYYKEWCEHRFFYNRNDNYTSDNTDEDYWKYFKDMNRFIDDIDDLLDISINGEFY